MITNTATTRDGSMRAGAMRVGQLARRTGLTVRTLHYYEEIGLLTPSNRTEAGHRLYGTEDVKRLQQIVLLRHMGFPMESIRQCLDAPGFSMEQAVDLHLSRLREQIGLLEQLCRRLEATAHYLRSNDEVSVDELLTTIQVITMHETYYTPEQLEQLKQRRDALGDERIRQYETEWSELIAAVRTEMEKGTDPASEPVQRLADRWMGLIEAFTGGDPGIRQSLETMYRTEGPEKASRGAVDAEVSAYMQQAVKRRKA